MNLTKHHLIETFNAAKIQDSKFVFVAIVAEGISEVIVIPKVSLEAKLNYYLQAYTDVLTHVMNSNVKIVGLTYGDESALLELI